MVGYNDERQKEVLEDEEGETNWASNHQPFGKESTAKMVHLSNSLSDKDSHASDNNFVQTNPMMDRIRSTLHEQLLQTRDRVKLEMLEQEEALRESKRVREDAGTELYGVQQQLSRLQTSLKTIDERYAKLSTERIEGQNKVQEARERHATKSKLAENLRNEASKNREELDSLLEKNRQAKKYNDAMKSDVAVTRTVASKTGKDLKARAKGKLDQDSYIDSLNRQVTRLEDEIALTDAQLRAQKEQSADAEKMIRETNVALEKLGSEQKRLVQQWNASVVALGRRDQALSVATKALKKVQDFVKDLEKENSRLERDTTALQESNGSMKVLRDRLDNEIAFIQNNITKVESNLVSLSERFEMLQETLKNTHQEEQALVSSVSKIESEISSANHKCELLIRERHAIEERISTMRHEQTNISEAAQNIVKEEKILLYKIRDKEIENANIVNEIARLGIDRLNTQAHNAQLEGQLREEIAALKEVEAKIVRQETDIRRCNDEIEKKTVRVAKLNRDYNKLVKNCEEEVPLGPLESTIKSLSKSIEQETSEIRALEREWLVRQTELINTTSKTNAIQEKDGESSARLDVLRQKFLRLMQEIHTNEASLKSIDNKTRGLHLDITRLNALIEQNTRSQSEYQNKISVNVMEFEREMAELDQHSTRLESQISEVHSNRKKILDELKETEEQVKVWEKKIQVEQETQEELQTSKDAIDTKGMEKEIQRMKHRLESLIRTQEQLLRDMELAIHRREDIAVKYHKNNKKQIIGTDRQLELQQTNSTMTKGELEKRIEREASRLKKLEESLQDAKWSVKNAREELDTMQRVLVETKERYNPVLRPPEQDTRCREEQSRVSNG